MHNVWNFLVLHQTISILVSYYITSAAIGSLPSPDKDSHKFYRWFFQFSNTLAGNLTRAFASKLPKEVMQEQEPPKP